MLGIFQGERLIARKQDADVRKTKHMAFGRYSAP